MKAKWDYKFSDKKGTALSTVSVLSKAAFELPLVGFDNLHCEFIFSC